MATKKIVTTKTVAKVQAKPATKVQAKPATKVQAKPNVTAKVLDNGKTLIKLTPVGKERRVREDTDNGKVWNLAARSKTLADFERGYPKVRRGIEDKHGPARGFIRHFVRSGFVVLSGNA